MSVFLLEKRNSMVVGFTPTAMLTDVSLGFTGVQTVGKDRRWSAWGQTCCLAELEAGLTGCGLWSLSPCKVTGSQRDMRHLKGGSLLLPDRLLCLQVAFVT